MTMRIETTTEGPEATVSLAGRLTVSEVGEVLKSCPSAEGQVVLDLTNLRSADTEGVKVIRELVSGGARLRGVPPFIRLLLDNPLPAEMND